MIYLDNAATSHPKPEEVYAGMDRFARSVGANPGRSGHRMAVEAEKTIASVRQGLAELFGVLNSSRLVFTLNATDALNMALKGSLEKGDHVVTTVLEHNSISRPLTRMERDGWITLTRLEPGSGGRIEPEAVERALTPGTKLIAMAHAGNVLGTVQPIGEIGAVARRRGCLFAVDAAQSAGLLPIDVERDAIDLLAFTGHKGLLGPVGTGGLYISERARLRPWREGGTGGDSAYPVQPIEFPHAMEAGTPNTVGIAGLGEAVSYVKRRGPENLSRHETQLAARLWEELARLPRVILYGAPPDPTVPGTGIVSLNFRGHTASEIGAILDASFGIAVRAGLHCAPGTHRHLGTFPEGTVRVSPGPFTTTQEIESLIAALKEIAS